MAVDIVYNAKVRRPTICNALDTVLVHRDIAPSWLPKMAAEWSKARVEIRADDEATRALRRCRRRLRAGRRRRFRQGVSVARRRCEGGRRAWTRRSSTSARHGSGHSEAIVTGDAQAASRFLNEVDAAAVFVNASTQFTDGGEFGLGAEVGISTQKLHARGPMGLRELTTYKWIVEGTGQIRP